MSAVATYIEIRQNRAGQPRAYIEGTRVRVQDVALMSERRGLSPDEICNAITHLTLGQVHAALSYYFDHRDTILCELREDEEFVLKDRAAHPGSVLDRVMPAPSSSPVSDAVSSR